jgi:Diadenosine tetraphosphate (Ap4A) hydrolase and other HIT family hydrolases
VHLGRLHFLQNHRRQDSEQEGVRGQDIFAFHDVHPVAPVHFMVIPKVHISSLAEVDLGHQMLLGKMLVLASKLAIGQGCGDGWRTVINTGRVGRQEVYHLHMHIIGGKEVLPRMIKR